ncbi:hypothetical protein JCM10295v2_000768 [Rhodotorula toruloides]
MKSLSLAAAVILASTAAHASLHDANRVERSLSIHRRGAAKANRRVKPQLVVDEVARPDERALSENPSSSTQTTAIWWAEDGWQGACGVTTDNAAMQVGLPLAIYPDPNAKSALCGTTAYATNPANGQSVTVTVVDGSDRTEFTTFSKAAYAALGGNLDTGMLPVVLSLSKGAAKAAQKIAAVNSVASSATSAVAAATPAKTSAPVVPASTAQETSTGKVTQAPTTVDAAASSAAAKKAYQSQQAQVFAASQASADAAAAAASSKAAADAAASSSAAAAAAASSKAAAAASSSSAAAAAAAASSKAAADAAAAKATQNANANKGGNNGGGNGGGQVFTGGIATFFYQNGVAGNCGAVNPDSALIVALPTATYANGVHCGQTVTITRVDTGSSIQAKVADSCPTCDITWHFD